MDIRRHHQIPGSCRKYRLQALADSLGKGGKSAHENRHIGTQRKPQPGKLLIGKAKLPEPVQRVQRCRGIGAAAAKPGAHRNPLPQPDFDPAGNTAVLLQQARTFDNEVFARGHAFITGGAMYARTLWKTPELQFITKVDELENRLQFVVAVIAAPRDVQHQIQLCRRRPHDGFA
jgi:hypothetical protein